jgi:hypothetical protein
VTGRSQVTIAGARINDNDADDDGGGIDVDYMAGDGSSLAITDSEVSRNTSGDFGAGIHLREIGDGTTSTAKVTIARTTFDLNIAGGYGGAVAIEDPAAETSGLPTVLIDSSTLSNNTTPYGGGGVFIGKYSGAPAVVEITNSTVSGNAAQAGGAVYTETNSPGFPYLTTLISHSTFTDNSANTSGGVEGNGEQEFVIDSSIIADNTGDDLDVDAPYTVTFSLIRTPGVGVVLSAADGNIVGVSPQLGPLELNEGTTKTHLVAPGSPAYNAGDPAFAGTGRFDQRGLARVYEVVDMGAVEWHPALAVTGSAAPEPETPLIGLLLLLSGTAMVAFSRLRTARSVS